LTEGRLNDRRVAYIHDGTSTVKEIEKIIEHSDDLSLACALVRFLYQREAWRHETAKGVLKQVFQFKTYLDVTYSYNFIISLKYF
jgi:hypothetical protein